MHPCAMHHDATMRGSHGLSARSVKEARRAKRRPEGAPKLLVIIIIKSRIKLPQIKHIADSGLTIPGNTKLHA